MLFARVTIFLLHATATSAVSPLPAERLILGFEQAELNQGTYISRQEKPGRESWFYLLEQSEGYDFAGRFEWPGETNRAWTWHCRPGAHTEGELALVTDVAPVGRDEATATYRQTESLSYFYPNIHRGFVEARLLMTSFQWLVKARPDLRDWSDYDLLRIDVHSDAAPVKLWLALEDDVLEPPVMRTYEIPADKWVTLELDLREAERVRELDLAKVANFWLMAWSSVRATVQIDNIRIARRGAFVPNELLQDNSTMAVPIVRPKRPEVQSIPSAAKPDRTIVRLEEPVAVARGSIVPFGWVSAYDNRFIFVAYSAKDEADPEAKDEARAVFTDDGGRSWKRLADPTARNLDHGTARGCAIDVTGEGIAVSSGPGCAGLGNANPRQHLTKYTFTGGGWQAEHTVVLDDMDGAYRATMSAVTKGDREIFFTATGLDTVLRWDGRSWLAEPVRIEDGGMLSLAGDVVALFTSGKVNRRWKGIRWQRRTILRCFQRLPGGQWEGPTDLTAEFTIDE